MFSNKTIYHNSGMNDNQLNNKVVIWTYTQQVSDVGSHI